MRWWGRGVAPLIASPGGMGGQSLPLVARPPRLRLIFPPTGWEVSQNGAYLTSHPVLLYTKRSGSLSGGFPPLLT